MSGIIQTGLRLLSSRTIRQNANLLCRPRHQRLFELTTFANKSRTFSSTPAEETVTVNFILKNGSRKQVKGKLGQHVMEVAQENDIDIEGACAASLACSTCHVYVSSEFFSHLEPPDDLEEDMLDQAPFLKENSRLSCQIVLSRELDGIEVTLPSATRNFYVDGKTPSHH